MNSVNRNVGYGKGEIEPKIASLVNAVQNAGFDTFSSCEGHIDIPDDEQTYPRLTSVAFYAHEDEALRVHEIFVQRYHGRLICSWCFTGAFVRHNQTKRLTLGWTLANCGIIVEGPPNEFITRTVEGAWNTDIPLLTAMFEDIAANKTGR